MQPEQTTCEECGATVLRVRIRDTAKRINLDAEPAPGGVWRLYVDRDTGDAEAWYRQEVEGGRYYRAHDYTCMATFQLRPQGKT